MIKLSSYISDFTFGRYLQIQLHIRLIIHWFVHEVLSKVLSCSEESIVTVWSISHALPLGVMGSNKVQWFQLQSEVASIKAVLSVVKSMVNFISQSCGDLQLDLFLGQKMELFKDHSSTSGCLIGFTVNYLYKQNSYSFIHFLLKQRYHIIYVCT